LFSDIGCIKLHNKALPYSSETVRDQHASISATNAEFRVVGDTDYVSFSGTRYVLRMRSWKSKHFGNSTRSILEIY
jgi:hypothetical protein